MDYFSVINKIKNQEYKNYIQFYSDILKSVCDECGFTENQADWIIRKCDVGNSWSEKRLYLKRIVEKSYELREFLNIEDTK